MKRCGNVNNFVWLLFCERGIRVDTLSELNKHATFLCLHFTSHQVVYRKNETLLCVRGEFIVYRSCIKITLYKVWVTEILVKLGLFEQKVGCYYLISVDNQVVSNIKHERLGNTYILGRFLVNTLHDLLVLLALFVKK